MAKPLSILRPFLVDHHILAVCKPAGLLSVPDATGDPSLVELMGSWLRGASSGAGHILSVHRLDRAVSGVVILARTTKAAQRLCAAFRSPDLVHKLYLARTEPLAADSHLRALCRDTPKGEVTVWMRHDGKNVVARTEPFEGARPARTRWALHGWLADGSAQLELSPEGGKRHHLRTAAAVGLDAPLRGDTRYGARHGDSAARGEVWLHAHVLAVPHPTARSEDGMRQRLVTLSSEPGLDGRWQWDEAHCTPGQLVLEASPPDWWSG
ncbi:pseudouridine synthase [Pavlovales sp. CCMP2436]|nr:pseudouridine synthase [Pavlovales sp. CCMP2436]|mmetsp:Transcript_28678/g.72135  ORF Transcript_28678/g.72135 Transcript_28678/m.72135 type:complete len:267 (+) Transcript_28678:73-873(+)